MRDIYFQELRECNRKIENVEDENEKNQGYMNEIECTKITENVLKNISRNDGYTCYLAPAKCGFEGVGYIYTPKNNLLMISYDKDADLTVMMLFPSTANSSNSIICGTPRVDVNSFDIDDLLCYEASGEKYKNENNIKGFKTIDEWYDNCFENYELIKL